MKKQFLILYFLLNVSIIFAQNEIELFSFEYSNSGQSFIENEYYDALNYVNTSTTSLNASLSFGHALGKKGWEAFYTLNYRQVRQKLDLSEVIQDSNFQDIPSNFYQQPKFSQLSLVTGLSKEISTKWNGTALLSLNATDDFFKSKIAPNLNWGSMAYLEKRQNERFTFGFGLFLNQLENRLLVAPVASLKFQNQKRGIEILFPERIRLWQKINQKSYLEVLATTQSFSIAYAAENEVNTTDIYIIRAGVAYNYLWEDFLKFSMGFDFPLSFHTISTPTETIDYSQQSGLGFKLGLSIIFSNE
jgi:hypothetical protein